MNVAIDTNVLLRSIQPAHPMHPAAVEALQTLGDGGARLVIFPQVVYEFWVVATRPAAENGLGMTTDEAESNVDSLLRLFTLLNDTAEVFEHWRTLVKSHDVKGKPAHDARMVAAMLAHGIDTIITFNGADFARYASIQVKSPDSIAN